MAEQLPLISVNAVEDTATAEIVTLVTSKQIRHILECVGQSVENAARQGALAKGGRSFWYEVANSISHQMNATGDTMTVGASHVAAGIKQTGGVIKAPGQGEGSLHRKALTIPVGIARENRWDTDEAESAGYEIFRNGDTLFGQLRQRAKKKRKGAAETSAIPLFILRKAVNSPADPWFPTGDKLNQAVAKGLQLFSTQNNLT